MLGKPSNCHITDLLLLFWGHIGGLDEALAHFTGHVWEGGVARVGERLLGKEKGGGRGEDEKGEGSW